MRISLLQIVISKPVIAITSSYDSLHSQKILHNGLEFLCKNYQEELSNFNFILNGQTYQSIFFGDTSTKTSKVDEETLSFFKNRTMVLPPHLEGGTTILLYLIAQNKISILWDFIHPYSMMSTFPSYNTMLRLCNIWNVKKFSNINSIERWLKLEAPEKDYSRNTQAFPLEIVLRKDLSHNKIRKDIHHDNDFFKIQVPDEPRNRRLHDSTISIITTESMTEQFVNFVKPLETELGAFNAIVTTHETSKILSENIPSLRDKIYEYHSNIEGGFVEIAYRGIV